MLTPQERKRVLYHLDYALLSLPTTLSLGLPIVTQARYLVEQNLLNIDTDSEQQVRVVVERLDCIETLALKATNSLIIKRAGDTEFRDDAPAQIWIEYARWVNRLADMLGGQTNPVSNAARGMMGGVVEGY